jgi:hypothetical protein
MKTPKSFYRIIRAWMAAAVILFNVSIQPEEAPEIVISETIEEIEKIQTMRR